MDKQFAVRLSEQQKKDLVDALDDYRYKVKQAHTHTLLDRSDIVRALLEDFVKAVKSGAQPKWPLQVVLEKKSKT